MGVIYRNCTGISYHFVHGISKCRCEYCRIKRLNCECCEDSGGLAGRSKNLFHQYKVTMWLRNNSAVLLWRADCKEIMQYYFIHLHPSVCQRRIALPFTLAVSCNCCKIPAASFNLFAQLM